MGELVRGVLLFNATRTASGSHTAYPVPAVAEGQRMVATLHVTAASPGDTLTVSVQSDSAQGMGSPTTQITFDAMTAVGAQQKAIDGPITDTWYRESRTIVGSGESFTYAVTVGVAYGAAAVVEEEGALPPDAQGNLVLAAPQGLSAGAQTITMLVGPDGQLGSAAGGDTNDPTFVSGPPARFTFDANDYITFGDVLDSTFINVAGFTIIHAMRTPVDQSGNKAMINKANSDPQYGFRFQTDGGKLSLLFSHDGTMGNRSEYLDDTALTADTRYIAAISYDPAAARASRGKMYVNGAARTVGNTLVGGDGAGIDNTGELRVGLSGSGDVPTGRESGVFYIYNRVLTPTEVLNNSDWIVSTLGWS